MTALVALGFGNSRVRGAVVAIATLLALIVYYAIAALFSDEGWSIQALVQMILGAAMIASGTHALRAPHRRLPRFLAGAGGVTLFLPFVSTSPIVSRRLLYEMGGELFYGADWAATLFAALLLVYATLGTLCLFSQADSKARGLAIRILGYGLLISFPVALYHSWWVDHRWGYEPQRTEGAALMLKFWLLATGHTVLLSAGLAAWAEGFRRADTSPSPDRRNGGDG